MRLLGLQIRLKLLLAVVKGQLDVGLLLLELQSNNSVFSSIMILIESCSLLHDFFGG